jgi:hypothetical protein
VSNEVNTTDPDREACDVQFLQLVWEALHRSHPIQEVIRTFPHAVSDHHKAHQAVRKRLDAALAYAERKGGEVEK